jgi:hypothetical protein
MLDRVDYFKQKSYDHLINSIKNAAEQYVEDNRYDLEDLNNYGYTNITLETLIHEGYLGEDLTNPKTNIPISINNVVYVAIDSKNKVEVIYDENQNSHPKIILNGPNIVKVKLGGAYTELNAFAINTSGVDISSQIVITGSVNTSIEGTYTLSYSVPNSIVIKRYVIVTSDFPKDDLEKPVLSSDVWNDYIETTVGVAITMPSVTATDNVDGITSSISPSSNNVNINQTGTYHIKYDHTDSSGNKADTLDITVVVK